MHFPKHGKFFKVKVGITKYNAVVAGIEITTAQGISAYTNI